MLVLVTAALVALTGAGEASLAVSFYVGPFAKLRLAFSKHRSVLDHCDLQYCQTQSCSFRTRVILATLLGIPGLIALGLIAAV